MAKLTNAALKRLIKKPGRHGDGRGLYFRVLSGQSLLGLSLPPRQQGARDVARTLPRSDSLDEARDRHGAERTKVRAHKLDPLAERRAAKQARAKASATPTFGAVADDHLAAFQDMGAGAYTVHGFRSAFGDWAGDQGVEFEIAENCLAHAVGNKVTKSLFASEDDRAPTQGHGGLGRVPIANTGALLS
jgi:hypothetical protein